MTLNQFPAKFGKYILLDRLNAGGMAEVFVAKASGVEGFERLVAIKCMLPALLSDSQFTAMFVDEARLAAQVAHANVVQIYELGRQAERLYIAMELVHGRDLRHIIRTAQMHNVVLPAAFSAYVISKAAEGLDYAHRRLATDGKPLGLVHRDVSPQNILVSYDGEVKVVDFGIAKAAAEVRATETQVGVLKGKFAYMAPEQVLGERIDRRADIFALGSVLFEALSGQRLFTGENDLIVLERVRDAVLPNLRAMLTPEAERILPVLNRALSLLPDMRYTYASEMAEALEPMLIEDQSIFGAKRAASVMQSLYRAEIEHNTALLRAYGDINASNCVAEIGPSPGQAQSAPVVYESTFYGTTPTAEDAHRQIASPPVVHHGEKQAVPDRSNTASGVRRPVTLSRRATATSRPVVPVVDTTEPLLDAIPAPESRFEPLTVASGEGAHVKTSTLSRTTLIEAQTKPSSNVRRVIRRMQFLFVFTLVAFGLCFYAVNRSLSRPHTYSELHEQVTALKPVEQARALWERLVAWRPVENWLFGPEQRTEPTALARKLAQAKRTKPNVQTAEEDEGPSDPQAAGSDEDKTTIEGFVTIKVAKNVQALVTIDDGDAAWAPILRKALPLGPHVVRAQRHRLNGKIEVRMVDIDVGPTHSAQQPMQVTLTF